MPQPASIRSRIKFRGIFRWCRIATLLLLFLLVVVGIYVDLIGLPGFMTNSLLAELRSHGVEMQFKSLRLRWNTGLVAQQVNFGPSDRTSGPQFALKELELELDHSALWRRQFKITALRLHEGQLDWKFSGTNQPVLPLKLEKIEAGIQFLSNDEWELDSLRAEFLGAKFKLNGSLAHGPQWQQLFAAAPAATNLPPSETPDMILRRFANALTNVQFSTPPEISMTFIGDALKPQNFSAKLALNASGAKTPWARFENLAALARLAPPSDGLPQRALVEINVGHAVTPWAEARQAHLSTSITNSVGELIPTNEPVSVEIYAQEIKTKWADGRRAHIHGTLPAVLFFARPADANALVDVGYVHTQWASGTNVHLQVLAHPATNDSTALDGAIQMTADNLETAWGKSGSTTGQVSWVQSLTNNWPTSLDGDWLFNRLNTKWGQSQTARLQFLSAHSDGPMQGDASWGAWASLEPFSLKWSLQLDHPVAQGIEAANLVCEGTWAAPELRLANLHVDFAEGGLVAAGRLNVASRQLRVGGQSDFDFRKLVALLAPESESIFKQLNWSEPPKLDGAIVATLPSWTNQHSVWNADALTSLRMNAHFQFTNLAYNGGVYPFLEGGVNYSNNVWHLPFLSMLRNGQQMQLTGQIDQQSHRFQAHVTGLLNLDNLRPLVDTNVQEGVSVLEFTAPPVIDLQVAGSLTNWADLMVAGQFAGTNFTIRHQTVGELRTSVCYSNNVLDFTNVQLSRAENEEIAGSLVRLDFNRDKLYLSNIVGRLDPGALSRAIGPDLTVLLAPYHCASPPKGHSDGIIPLHGNAGADVWFFVEDAPFSWWRFNARDIAAEIHWKDDFLTLTNVRAIFYGGQLAGTAVFNMAATNGNDLNLNFHYTNVDFHSLMSDVSTTSNKVEGSLTGELHVTSGDNDMKHWEGSGWVMMRDGLIWDLPMFGVFSPMLNGIAPGLGSSRAKEGSASFLITNSVIRSDDLEIQANAVRMHYSGTVDFNYRIQSRMEAEVLGGTWAGPVLQVLLMPLTKLFEYKVTGTLDEPKTAPLFIPKFITAPFHPFRTIKNIFSKDNEPPPSMMKAPEK